MSSDAQDRRVGEAERSMSHVVDDMEERSERLRHDIDEARHGGDDIHEAQQIPGFHGDWREENDAGGADPSTTVDAEDGAGDSAAP